MALPRDRLLAVFALALELVSTVVLAPASTLLAFVVVLSRQVESVSVHTNTMELIEHSVTQYTYAGVFPIEYPTLTSVSRGGVS